MSKGCLYRPNQQRFEDILNLTIRRNQARPIKFHTTDDCVLTEFSLKKEDGSIENGFYTIAKNKLEELTKDSFDIDKRSTLFWSLTLKS